MRKVITYGTFDFLHYGHVKLLERAKKLGDYLIVGVTADDFDKVRGKINVQQSLAERIEAVKKLGIADKIIVEEYEGQKIDDIKRYGIDIFTVGSDWIGKFDYLNEYCEVKYLDRTKGISSTQLRNKKIAIQMGIVGDYAPVINKFQKEDKYVNGIEIKGICTNNIDVMSDEIKKLPIVTDSFEELLNNVDAVYIRSSKEEKYNQVKKAINMRKHVLVASPIAYSLEEGQELIELAQKNKVILIEDIKTAYSTAYSRLLLLLKSGKIGKILSVDATCTSIRKDEMFSSIKEWGPTALLPIFQILGTNYINKSIITYADKEQNKFKDKFTKINFVYNNSIASIMVASKAKSEGQLVVTGTKGYLYVPAPWWNTDYFEIRFENQQDNKRYFYQLDGEGIRYELLIFARSIQEGKNLGNINDDVTLEIVKTISDFENKKDLYEIK